MILNLCTEPNKWCESAKGFGISGLSVFSQIFLTEAQLKVIASLLGYFYGEWNMNHKLWLVLHFHIKSTWSRRPLNALISWCGLSLEWLLSSFLSLSLLSSLHLFVFCCCFVFLVSLGQAISISALSIVQASCARLICLLNVMTASFIIQ